MSIRASTSAQRLTERMTFRRPVLNDAGDIIDWALIVRDMRVGVDGAKANGPERTVVDGTRSVAGYTVWARAEEVERFALDVTCRGEWKGKLFDIKDIPDQGLQGRLLALFCEVGVNQG